MPYDLFPRAGGARARSSRIGATCVIGLLALLTARPARAAPPSSRSNAAETVLDRRLLRHAGPTRTWRPAPEHIAAALLVPLSVWALGDGERAGTTSDVLQVALPAAAIAGPLLGDRPAGLRRAARAFPATIAFVYGLKALVPKMRPDASRATSFPSGHTAAAFSGASLIAAEYGASAGLPAYTAALAAGLARVSAERHYLDDVIGGAGIALLTTWGMQSLEGTLSTVATPRWRVAFEFGVVFQDENEIEVPAAAGSTFDLGSLADWQDLLPTAAFRLEWYPRKRIVASLAVRPLELRGASRLEEGLVFEGHTYQAGEQVSARWLGSDVIVSVSRQITPRRSPVDLRIGLAAAWRDYRVELDGTARRSVGSPFLALLPTVEARHAIHRDWSLHGSLTGVPGLQSQGLDVELGLRWQVRAGWDVGVGYRLSSRRIAELDNDPINHGFHLSFARSF